MPLSLPGALSAVVADLTTGLVTVTTASGEVMAAGSVAPGTKAWLDTWGRVVLEAPNGEQTLVGQVAGAPADPVYRGTNPAVMQLGRRWSTSATTDATGALSLALPAGLFASVWAVNATTVGVGGFSVVTSLSASAVGLQVWTGTAVLLGGQTLAKPAAPVQVLVEVSGPAPATS